MSKSELTINPTGTTRGLNGRGRLLALVVGLLAFAGVALAGPVGSQAAEYMEVNNGGWSTPDAILDLGVIQTGTTLDKQFRMRSNSTVFSNTQRVGNFNFSDSNFNYISDCSGTSYTFTINSPTSFTLGKRQSALGSFECLFRIQVKNTLAPGNYQTTMSWSSNQNYTSGSTILKYSVVSPTMSLTEQTGAASPLNLGDVAVGDAASRVMTVTNTSPFQITGMNRAISGSGDITITGTTCGATLSASSSCTINVQYQPSSASTASGTLNVTSSSGHSASYSFSGQGVPPVASLSVSPGSHDYGDVVNGFPVPRTFTVSNTGNTTLSLTFAQTGGTPPAVLYRDGGTCGATLGVGLTCTMIVRFNPDTAGPAAQTGSFSVTGTTPLVGSPATQNITISGTRAVAASTIQARNTAGTLEVTSHNFTGVSIGGSSAYTFKVANTGNITIPSIAPTLTGPEASSYSITGNTCGSSIMRDTSCDVTVTSSPTLSTERRATLVLTPAANVVTAPPRSVTLSTFANGIQIKNDQTGNFQALSGGALQKNWLETLTINPGGSVSANQNRADTVRVAFEVELPATTDIEGVEIANQTTTNDSAPASATYTNMGDFSGGAVKIERKPGSTRALVTASVPVSLDSLLGAGNGQYGFSDGGVLLDVQCANLFPTGNYKTDNRRLWFRIRGSGGQVTAPVGSAIRFVNSRYTCPVDQGPGMMGQRIAAVGGNAVTGNTTTATVEKSTPVTFDFVTRTAAKGVVWGSDGNVSSVNVRIRNAKTGQMFRYSGGNYVNCTSSSACAGDSGFENGARYTFPDSLAGPESITIPGIPSRGRWIVEGSLRGSDQDLNRFYQLGVLRINSTAANSPTATFGGTLGARPDTDENYTISVSPSDPADPVNTWDSQGGRPQVIEWDLDGNPDNGPLNDGFEYRSEGDPSVGIAASDLTRAFTTTGKTPGPYKIRARVTDNGSTTASDDTAQTRVFEFNTTINTPPQPVEDVIYLESSNDPGQSPNPSNIHFRSTDIDNDPYRVAITPDGGNAGSLSGNLNGPFGDNTKPYSWPTTFTGSDTFAFVPTDDHKGTGSSGVLTIKVRPNTRIDSVTIPSTLHHPDLSDPAKRFLGATTATSAEFQVSSPQNPVVAYECRHLLDGDVVDDWSECSDQSTADVELQNLGDGLHRLEIRAINDEGVEDGTPDFRTWRVDNTGPDTEVFVAPPSNLPAQQPRLTNDTTPTYKFRATASERSAQQYMTYECRVMWGPLAGVWLPCGSPSDTNSSAFVNIVNGTPDFGIDNPLPEGTYEIQVRGTDEVGNLGPAMIERLTVDTTPPDTALASGPEGLINIRNPQFVLGSSQAQSTFLCKLEGQNSGVVFALAPCPGSAADGSRPSFSGLADDIYTLTAIAIDPAQNQDPTPLEVEFEVDATEPTTTMNPLVKFTDEQGPTALRRTQSRKVDITFSGADNRQLQGFQCRLDSSDDEDWQICESVQRFSGLPDGPHKAEIRARDEAGNFDSTPEVLEWTVDRTPPVTTVTTAPQSVSNDANPNFGFSVNEATSGSVCSLDGAAPVACSDPFTLSDLGVTGGLSDGDHTITIRSTDIAGNIETTVASINWRQDTVTPEVTFTSKPGGYTPLGDVSFGWAVKDGNPMVLAPEVQAICALDPVDPDNIDAGEWSNCGRDLTVAEADNVNGPHFLAVAAVDQAGNVSAPATHSWIVLGSKPSPPVVDDSSPVDGAVTRVGTAYFAISHELEGTGALDTMLCSIDGGTQTPCGDGDNYSVEGLANGPHVFSVVARDIGGNISDPTEIHWEVQRGAPHTSIDFGPSGNVKQSLATFEFSSNKPGTFECRVDGSAWSACVSPHEIIGLDDGAHSFSVRAVSTVAPVGIKDPTPPVRNWTIDTVAPSVQIDSAPQARVQSYQASFAFSSNDSTATFQCKVGTGLFQACASPWQLNGLTAGDQTVSIRAVDAAGNTSAPADHNWVIEDPVCDPGYEGTPPNCTPIPPVDGPAISAISTGGSLSIEALGDPVDLPQDQIKLEGKRGTDGRWFVPASGVNFAPISQVIPDALAPGSDVKVTIKISATGDAWGVLPSGGGAASLRIPVRADIEALLGSDPLLPEGTECSLRPITFNLVGTYNEQAMTADFSQANVGFPKLTGCGIYKGAIDNLLALPRDDIALAASFAFTAPPAECPAGTTGTYPDCVTDTIVIGKPVVVGKKQIKTGKPFTYRVRVQNTGSVAATSVRVCLSAPKRFFVGKKALRCKSVASLAAGQTAVVQFKTRTKKFKVKKNTKVNLRAVVIYKDSEGKSQRTNGQLKVMAKAGAVK